MLFVVIDVFSDLDEFLKKGISIGVVTQYYLFLMPSLLVQIVPIATLVALLYILGNLSRHNEIIALKASGLSSFQILTPLLFMGLLISFAVFIVSEKVIPKTAITSTAIKEGVIEKGRASMEERAISNVTVLGMGNRQIFAREFEVMTNTLYDVVILYEGPGQTIKSKLTAKKARYEEDHWVFRDVMKYQLKPDGDISGEPVYAARLELDIEEKPEDFLRENSTVEFMSSMELRHYIGNFKGGSPKRVRRLSVDFYDKIAFPFISFVVILIGAPLAMRSVRGSAMVGIGTSLAVVLLFYGAHSACLALGKGGTLPPLIAAWAANIAFTLVGAYLIREAS